MLRLSKFKGVIMKCPTCTDTPLVMAERQGVEIDYCPACRGIWLDRGELERAAGLSLEPEHSRLMICGNPQMIDDTRARLKQRDLQLSLTRRPGQVAVENYW